MVRMETHAQAHSLEAPGYTCSSRTESRAAELAHVRRLVGIGIVAGTLQPGISVPRPWYGLWTSRLQLGPGHASGRFGSRSSHRQQSPEDVVAPGLMQTSSGRTLLVMI